MTHSPAELPSLLDEPVPDVDLKAAARLAAEGYGLTGAIESLRSERDCNFLLTTADGSRFVLKVSNSAERPEIVDLENRAMLHMAESTPELAIPAVVEDRTGARVSETVASDGRRHLVRLMSVVSGTASDEVPLQEGFGEELGRTCALAAKGLRGFDHPAATRSLEWDARHVYDLRDRLSSVTDQAQRGMLERLLDRCRDLPERTANLFSQVAHCDVTLSNVMTEDGRHVTGLIDFGDIHRSARIADLAIALASLLRESTDVTVTAGEFLRGYQRVVMLEEDEIRVLGDLLTARLAATVLITSSRQATGDAYANTVDAMLVGSWRALDQLTTDGPDALTDKLLRAAGLRWSSPRAAEDLHARRESVFGNGLVPLFYRRPLEMVRGEGAWMWTAEGRRYLDAYNNVPVIGHAHPAVAQAVGRQIATLNVNIRYLHPNSVELAERLLATLPASLDTCIFVNSGSEANDLAWRMALLYTGRSGALVTDSSYHGVSAATAPLSANTWPAGFQPQHVATMPPPPHVEPSAEPTAEQSRAADAAAVAAATDWLDERSLHLALCLADPMFTSGGIRSVDPEYVRALADSVKAAGGLFLADEVQAGFGRSGTGLWSFSRFGIEPDFVTLGKPMGNGFPVAALITRSEIASRLTAVDEFFSTFGGTPAAAAAALTVLDVIESEHLVARSGARGQQLREAVADRLRDECDVAVRGSGLIAGIDFGPGNEPITPQIVEYLAQQQILVSNTGPSGETLKVRPPLIWSDEHIEFFVEGLHRGVRALRPTRRNK